MWVLAASSWQFGLGFVANIVLTRLLDPSAFGQFALATFFAQLFSVRSKIGLGHAFIQDQGPIEDTLATFCLTESAAALGGVAVMACMSPLLACFGYPVAVVKVSIAVSLAVCFEGLWAAASTVLSKELHFKEVSILTIVLFPLSYIPVFLLALRGWGVWSIVAHGLIYNFAMAVFVWLAVRSRLPQFGTIDRHFRPAVCRRFFRFGVTVGLGTFAAMLLTQMDNFLVGTFVGISVLGLYDRAFRIAEWPGALANRLILSPVFSAYSRLQNDRLSLERMVTMVLWGILSLTLPAALAVFVVAPDLIYLLYGPTWVPAAPFLRFLIIFAVMKPLWDNGGVFFIAMGKPGLTTASNVIQVMVLIAAGFPLTLRQGAMGTCAAVGLAFAVGILILYRSFGKEISLRLTRLLTFPVLAAIQASLSYLIIDHVANFADFAVSTRVGLRAGWIVCSFYAFMFLAQPSVVMRRTAYVLRLLTGKELPRERISLD